MRQGAQLRRPRGGRPQDLSLLGRRPSAER